MFVFVVHRKVRYIFMLAIYLVCVGSSFAKPLTIGEQNSKQLHFFSLADTIPVIAKITTSNNNLLSLEKGAYVIKLKVFKTSGTKIPQFSTQIEDPYINLNWNIENINQGEWVSLQQDLVLDSAIVNSEFSITVDNNFGQGWGSGAFYIDDIKFEKKVVTAVTPASKTNYSVYPNPFSNGFKINAPKGSTINVFSLSGNLVYTSVLSSSNTQIFLPQLNYGLYLLKINYQGNNSSIKLFKTN